MLFESWPIGPSQARNRVVFGPHVTNLAEGRALSRAHAAYYARRAAGGCGVVVTETASVHSSDWPYERAPLAEHSASGWARIADEVQGRGAMVIASLGHSGMQGSTAYSQDVLWAPSLMASVATHEMPLVMEPPEIAELREATLRAAGVAIEAGCDGVELNAGQFSLFRQFMSALTNHRDDEWAAPLTLVSAVLADLRSAYRDCVLGVRISADELAPWAGITPDMAGPIAEALSIHVDYITVERGSIYSESATRPDMQVEPGFNRELLAIVRGAVRDPVAVVAQGSIVGVAMAETLLEGHCHAVEMTRAQIADPDLVRKARSGAQAAVRPCVLCNQGCQVRDVRNPIITCSVNPSAGHEIDESGLDDERQRADLGGHTLSIVGAGPAGLEAARRAALRGARVTIRERRHRIGGALLEASQLPGRQRWEQLVAWYEAELARLGVTIEVGAFVMPGDVTVDLAATGRSMGRTELRDGDDGSVPMLPAASLLVDEVRVDRAVVNDPIGGVIGVGVAELLARSGTAVTLITPDLVAGNQLSLSGDLVGANSRLANLGVTLLGHSTLVAISDGRLSVEDRFDGEQGYLEADIVVDAGYDMPWEPIFTAPRIGDALAPRTVLSAILEGRRFAASMSAGVAR